MKAVIDTDIFVDILHKIPDARKILFGIANGKILAYYSVITEAELLSGNECENLEKRSAVIDLLTKCTKISLNNEIAQRAGELRRKYGLSLPDAIIGSTAIFMKTKVMTRNTRDFERAGIKIIKPY
jgi:predicted nucleic acid-binding protein